MPDLDALPAASLCGIPISVMPAPANVHELNVETMNLHGNF